MTEYPNQSKLDSAAHSAIVEGTRVGLKQGLCAQSAGVARRTLQSWISTGHNDLEKGINSKYAQLVVDVGRAKAAKAEMLLNLVHKAAKSDPKHWQAAAWALEREHDYTKTETINQNHTGAIESVSNDAIAERTKQIFMMLKTKATEDDNPVQ